MCTGNIRLLGKGTDIELARAWDSIRQEYSDLTLADGTNGKNVFEIYKKIVYTQWKMLYLDYALNSLKVEYDEAKAIRITDLGYDLIKPLENQEDYFKQIIAIETEAKFLIIHMNQLVAEYTRLAPTSDKVARTELDYEKELALLSKYMGQRLKSTEITVFEFATILSVYIDEHKKR